MSTSDDSRGKSTVETEPDEYRYERAPNERPSEAVVSAVADAAARPTAPGMATDGVDAPDALAPLYEKLDPDALDAFFAVEDGRESDRSLTFTYDDYAVTVRTDLVTVVPVA